jgi:hypothetical protein
MDIFKKDHIKTRISTSFLREGLLPKTLKEPVVTDHICICTWPHICAFISWQFSDYIALFNFKIKLTARSHEPCRYLAGSTMTFRIANSMPYKHPASKSKYV